MMNGTKMNILFGGQHAMQLYSCYNYITFPKWMFYILIKSKTASTDVYQHSPPRLTARLSCAWGPSVCLASMSQLVQPVVYSLSFVWVTKATVHTHFPEKRPVVTLRDDRSNIDLGRHLTAHQRNADVTLWYFFQGLLAQARLSSNQECDRDNLCLGLITHSNHIIGGKPGKGYILWETLAFRGFLVVAFSS